MLVLNPNPVRLSADVALRPPRQLGRGQSVNSHGVTGTVTYANGNIVVNNVVMGDQIIAAVTPAPLVLDFSYDQLDRPQVIWTVVGGSGFLYFYDGTLADYRTMSLGPIGQPVIHNDYPNPFYGVNTIAGYLKGSALYCRLQSDRFGIEYLWQEGPITGVQGMGYSDRNNTIQVVVW